MPLVSAKCGLAGNHGQRVLVPLVKCAATDHVLVFAVVLVSLASRVAAETRLKRAHVLLERANGANGTKRPYARQSNPDAALAQRLIRDPAMADQVCALAPHRKRKCVSSTHVLAFLIGRSGRLARLHVVAE